MSIVSTAAHHSPAAGEPLVSADRIGGAPITWGVCEVPGWGVMLPADRVLAEMRSLGLSGTELGAPGFLPRDPDALRALLEPHGLSLIGGFVPVVLHDPSARQRTLAEARATAQLFCAAGATMFVSAVVVDEAWSPRRPLADSEWDHLVGMLGELDDLCAEYGLIQALHPHVGTLVETAADVRTVLDRSAVRWCLDTGHLAIGGYDPAEFAADAADRVAHVHLKDIDVTVAAEVRRGALTIQEGVGRGLFLPLGDGGAPVAGTIATLERAGYSGWYVLEQDEDLGPVAPAQGAGPLESARRSLDYVRSLTAPPPS
ncbi:TIM barrel protein [Desertimonas flava]|jgi:inosose dehydratase|uniref:TIM barrel protein n=1 Tax=Desertimonas flava TaxID=2064846 RepID=UPI000E355A8E|nr:TIM barrel protein [Desertimonas flava]